MQLHIYIATILIEFSFLVFPMQHDHKLTLHSNNLPSLQVALQLDIQRPSQTYIQTWQSTTFCFRP